MTITLSATLTDPRHYDSITLTWNADPDADYYHVYKNGIMITNSPSNSYIDTGNQSTTIYSYNVEPHYPPKDGIISNTVTITTPSPKKVAIFAPNITPALINMVNTRLNSNDRASSFMASKLVIYPNVGRCINAFSLDSIKAAIQTALTNGIQFVGYDNEANNGNLSTPAIELNSPGVYTDKACALVKAAGLGFSVQPTHDLLIREYQHMHWENVDFVVMQLQRFYTTTSTVQYVTEVQAFTSYVKQKNPNCTIFAQVNLSFNPLDVTLSFLHSIWNSIDGISIVMADATTLGPFLDAIGR